MKKYYTYTPDTINYVQNIGYSALDAFECALDTLCLSKRKHKQFDLPFKLEAYVQNNAEAVCLRYCVTHYKEKIDIASINIDTKCEYPFLKIENSPFMRHTYEQYLNEKPFTNIEYVQTTFKQNPKAKVIATFNTYMDNLKRVRHWQLKTQHFVELDYYNCELYTTNSGTFMRFSQSTNDIAYNEALKYLKAEVELHDGNLQIMQIDKKF